MNQCQNCGQINTNQSNFCRFCGTKFIPQQPQQAGANYEDAPPRPYLWKTDEFQINETKPRQVNQAQAFPPPMPQMPMPMPMPHPQPLVQQQHHNLAYNFHCPRCATTMPPRFDSRVSTGGWITFAALLIFFFPLFWIGLLIKENVRVCSVCNLRID